MSKSFKLAIGILLLVLAIVISSYWLFFVKQIRIPFIKNSTNLSLQTYIPTSDIKESLFTDSKLKNKFGLGYVLANTKSTVLNVNKALAVDNQFVPTLFYTRAETTNFPQIYTMNLATKTESQVTTNDKSKTASDPVFSSRSQKLAFSQYSQPLVNNVAQSSDLAIMDLVSKKIEKVIKGNGGFLQPIAWSADGLNLLIIKTGAQGNIVSISQGTDEVNSSESLEIYKLDEDKISEIIKPVEINQDIAGAYWLDTNNIVIQFWSNDNQNSNQINSYIYDLTNQKYTAVNFHYPNQKNTTVTSKDIFYLTTGQLSSEVTAQLARENIDDNTSQIFDQTARVYDYLVGLDNGSVKSIVISLANPGAISQVNPDTGIVATELDTGTDTALFVGYDKDFQHVIYTIMPGGSGATSTQIRELNLNSSQDELVAQTGLIW